MSDFQYTHLGAGERIAMLEGWIRQWEGEHYGHAINARNAEVNGTLSNDQRRQALGEAQNAQAALESAIVNARQELETLRGSVPQEAPQPNEE